MEELLARIRQLENDLEALKTKERGALDLLYPTQTVTAAGGAASIVFPAAGTLPTNFKSLRFSGRLRGTKNATVDILNVTVNAVAAGYYLQYVSGNGATATAAESLNAATWPIPLNALTAPAGIFSPFEITLFDYATNYYTLMSAEIGAALSLLTGNIYSRNYKGFINSSQAVTSVTFAFAGGNIAQNSYLSCYGVSG